MAGHGVTASEVGIKEFSQYQAEEEPLGLRADFPVWTQDLISLQRRSLLTSPFKSCMECENWAYHIQAIRRGLEVWHDLSILYVMNYVMNYK